MGFPMIMGEQSCTVFVGSELLQVDRTSPNWEQIKQAIRDEDADRIRYLMKPITALEDAIGASAEAQARRQVTVEIQQGKVFFDGYAVHNELTRRMLDIVQEGLDVENWIAFAQNLYANPLESAREEIFDFLSKCNMPITDDGHFLAYKRVRHDYRDVHSGTYDNSVGQVVEMPRSEVDPNRHNLCSRGLHFCSKDYLPNFSPGGRVMVVKINPADVVAIPTDYNNAKGRTWRYEVVGEIEEAKIEGQTWRPVDSYGYDTDDDQWADPDADDDDTWDDDLATDADAEEECDLCGSRWCDGECEDEDDDEGDPDLGWNQPGFNWP